MPDAASRLRMLAALREAGSEPTDDPYDDVRAALAERGGAISPPAEGVTITLDGIDWKARAQAAEQALSDLKREVLEKVGPFAETAAVLGNSKDSAVWAGQKPAPPLTFGHFRALSTLHDKLSSIEVRPELPSGDVSTHAAGGAEGSTSPNESAS